MLVRDIIIIIIIIVVVVVVVGFFWGFFYFITIIIIIIYFLIIRVACQLFPAKSLVLQNGKLHDRTLFVPRRWAVYSITVRFCRHRLGPSVVSFVL